MAHAITRRWTRSGCHVASDHPEVGPIDRGTVYPERERVEGAGAYGVWRLADADHTWLDLYIAGDYLTAEQILLDRSCWAEEPAGPDPDNTEE